MALNELPDSPFRQNASEFVHRPCIFEYLDGWKTAHTVLRGQLLLLIGVDFGELKPALVFACKTGQNWIQHLARVTPIGPEIDQHWHFPGLFEDLLVKTVSGHFHCVSALCHLAASPDSQ